MMFGVWELRTKTVYSRSSTARPIVSAVCCVDISAEVVRRVDVGDVGQAVYLSALEAEPFEMLHLERGSRPGRIGQLERARQRRLVQRIQGPIQISVLLAKIEHRVVHACLLPVRPRCLHGLPNFYTINRKN